MRLTVTLAAAGTLLLLAAPLAPEAQQTAKVPRIVVLTLNCGPNAVTAAFDATMKQLGYVEGQNFVIQRRYLCQRQDEVDEAVQEAVRLKADVIYTTAIRLSAAAKRATNTIPIVFFGVRAPVERGLVTSLARPGGNMTGMATFPVATIDAKLFQLAKELIPQLTRVAVLRSADDPPGAFEAQDNAARSLRLKLVPIPFSNSMDLSSLPAALDRSNAQLLIAPDTSLAWERRKEIVQLVAKKRLPTAYAFRESIEDGGLIGVSADFEEMARHGAMYVDKILRGAKPGDLPVVQPTKLNVTVNLKTAKALGLTIPPSVLLRADQVIE